MYNFYAKLITKRNLTLIILAFAAISGVVAYNNHKLKKEATQLKPEVSSYTDGQERSQDDQVTLIPPKENA